MADVEPETADYSRPRYRNRTERRARANRYADGVDVGSASAERQQSNSTENNAVPGMDYLSPVTAEREPVAPRKERKERRSKPKDEPEVKANDEEIVEGAAAAAAEDTSPKKSLKKERSSDNSARKRKAKKNLREKRRSTGVVIMPNMDSEEDEDKTVKANTQQNEQLPADDGAADQDEEVPKSKGSGNKRIEQKAQRESEVIEKQHMQEKIDVYESQVLDFKSQLDKANKELEQLRLDNQRLKDENSSLLRVVSQLSTMKSK